MSNAGLVKLGDSGKHNIIVTSNTEPGPSLPEKPCSLNVDTLIYVEKVLGFKLKPIQHCMWFETLDMYPRRSGVTTVIALKAIALSQISKRPIIILTYHDNKCKDMINRITNFIDKFGLTQDYKWLLDYRVGNIRVFSADPKTLIHRMHGQSDFHLLIEEQVQYTDELKNAIDRSYDCSYLGTSDLLNY